jgi:hypothetical protein
MYGFHIILGLSAIRKKTSKHKIRVYLRVIMSPTELKMQPTIHLDISFLNYTPDRLKMG